MNNKKLFTVLIALTALTFVLSACDGVTIENLQSSNRMSADFLASDLNNDSFNSMNDDSKLNDISNDGSVDDSMSSSMSSSSTADFRSNDLKVKGEVSAVTADSITIGGVTYSFDIGEDLTTLFSVGDTLEVEYFINDDGSITLHEFEFEDSMDDDSDDDDYTEVKAYITEVTANSITINGQTIIVETLDDLSTLFMAGQIYEIEYMLNPDGTITLLSVELDDDMDDDSDDDMDDDMDDDDNDDMNDDDYNNDNNDNNNDDNYDNNNDDNNNDDSNNNNNDDHDSNDDDNDNNNDDNDND